MPIGSGALVSNPAKVGGVLSKGNLAGLAASTAGQLIGGKVGKRNPRTGGAISGLASGAGTGATIGSIIPGVGTVIGGALGGLIGGIKGFLGGRKRKKEMELFRKQKALEKQKQVKDFSLSYLADRVPTITRYGGGRLSNIGSIRPPMV